MKIGCVLMLAGSGSRFGGNKLVCPVDGVPMAQRVMETLSRCPVSHVAAVVQSRDVFLSDMAKQYGFNVVYNNHVELGASHTIRLGTEALTASDTPDGIMYLVGDQPWLTKDSIEALIKSFKSEPERIWQLACATRRGNPVIFPPALYGELCELEGDVGGSVLIRKYPDLLCLCRAAREKELMDFDYREALQ